MPPLFVSMVAPCRALADAARYSAGYDRAALQGRSPCCTPPASSLLILNQAHIANVT